MKRRPSVRGRGSPGVYAVSGAPSYLVVSGSWAEVVGRPACHLQSAGVTVSPRSRAEASVVVSCSTPQDRHTSPSHLRGLAAMTLLSARGVPLGVPLPGSQCGAGNGRTIAWTAHDDESSFRDRSLVVAEQTEQGRRARCQAQW